MKKVNSVVYNQDCMEGMRETPDKFYDLAVVDPPYGIEEDGRNNHTRSKLTKAKDYRGKSKYDSAIPDLKYFEELFRVSRNQIIWGGNYYIEFLKNTPCIIVWDKNNGGNDFADFEMAWSSFDTAARKFKYTWHGMLQEDMKNKEVRIHPNHKPIALYSWIYHNYLPGGGKVLDTHLGSGSNRIAADKAGNIDFTAYEIDKDYFEAQEKRYQNFISQLTMDFNRAQ